MNTITTVKEQAMELLAGLPEEVSWQDIVYQFYVRSSIEEGIKASEDERVISHDEVKRLFA
jgi:hypothetical protein